MLSAKSEAKPQFTQVQELTESLQAKNPRILEWILRMNKFFKVGRGSSSLLLPPSLLLLLLLVLWLI